MSQVKSRGLVGQERYGYATLRGAGMSALRPPIEPEGLNFPAKSCFLFPGKPFSMKGKPVAQKVQVLLVDDLDGGEADETVTFAVDGVSYEIDLTTENADKLRKLLAPYVEHGRRIGGRSTRGRGKGARSAASAASSQDTAKIRRWAKENGYEVNDRGRVPAQIREAYEKAHA